MKQFGHLRHTRDEAGAVVETKLSPARAKTVGELPGNYGLDKGRKLVVSLDSGDLITVRPAGTTRSLAITAVDLYAILLRYAAGRENLTKARAVKERRAVRLAARRQASAERRLLR